MRVDAGQIADAAGALTSIGPALEGMAAPLQRAASELEFAGGLDPAVLSAVTAYVGAWAPALDHVAHQAQAVCNHLGSAAQAYSAADGGIAGGMAATGGH